MELSEIFQDISEKSTRLMERFETNPQQLAGMMEEWLAVTKDCFSLANVIANNPEPLLAMQTAYFKDAMGLWQEQCSHALNGTSLPIDDKRFSADAWKNNPFFNGLSQHYLLASEHINSLLEHLTFEDKVFAKRVKFVTKQYLDAISPSNFLQTNPEILAETLQSHGKNLLLGLQNLLSDMDGGSSRLVISLTNKKAFTVGVNIAITPGNVIFRNEFIELIQYSPQSETVNSVPLLIIPPWINKYYILDLSERNSLTSWLVKQGMTVFIISWINPDGRYAKKGMNDYLTQGPLAAIEAIKTQLNVPQVNALGFCIGGTLLSMTLAYNKALNDNSIRSATFLASLIDFSDPGEISVFIDEEQISKLEKTMKVKGYLEGDVMAGAFNALRANDLIWAFFIRNYLHGKPPVPFDLLFWNMDTTNMPETMHSQYLRAMYLRNDLVKPGKIKINNVPLDISSIDTPVFFVSTKKDHIAPWESTYLGFQLMGGKKRFLLGGSGHIAGIIIPPGTEKYGFYRNLGSPKNPKDWLDKATYQPGSWWPEWLTWLKKQSGKLVTAPIIEELPLKSLMSAPGSYVFKQSKPRGEKTEKEA